MSESEGSNFWLSVLTDLKSRGVNDILIACIDNLTGFSDAILSVFPGSKIQTCVIYRRAAPQIRNSLKYVASKDQKTFMQDLKNVYQAPTQEKAELELEKLDESWAGRPVPKKISYSNQVWYSNWHKLSTYFAYDEQIRRLIYTTNAVEGLHRQVRKITKTKPGGRSRSVSQRYGFFETNLSGRPKYQQKMDLALAKLGHNRPATVYQVRG